MDPINLFDFESRSKQSIPHDIWDFIASGAQDGITTRRNRSAFESILLRPQFLRDVRKREMSTTILGKEVSCPLIICPTAGHVYVHPDGELAVAKAASSTKTLMILSSVSHYTIEEVSKVSQGPLWFQLYHRGKEMTTMLVRRAENAGYAAICLTVDVPLTLYKEQDVRNAFQPPKAAKLGNFENPEAIKLIGKSDPSSFWSQPPIEQLTFKQLDWLRSLTSLPLVIKGIRTPGDARLCIEQGVDGLLVSNHGGRQVDNTLSSIETLPSIVEVVKGRAEIYLDSGVRRGSDVLKALSLGARAVGFGRPTFWGLALDGTRGVERVINIVRDELDLAMGYCGVASIDKAHADLVSLPHNMEPHSPSYLSELRSLSTLLDEGVITKSEFAAKKKLILGI